MIFLFLIFNITYHSIKVDGNLSDFENDEKVISDRYEDSFWGTQNEITNFYLTWDRDNIYIGLEYNVKNNALLIVIDAGYEGLEDLDILNWYPRNLKLSGIEANYLLALWDADFSKGGFRKIFSSGATTDLTSNIEVINKGMSGSKSYIEAKLPFNLIFENGFSKDAKIKFFICIAGGDHSGAGDVAPDNSDVDGIAPDYIRKFALLEFDKNSDFKPDSGIKPIFNLKIEEAQFEKIEIKKFYINKEDIKTGEINECLIEISKSSNINLILVSEEGKLYKKLYNGIIPANEIKSFSFKISKPGIYILLLEIPGKLREKKILKVIK